MTLSALTSCSLHTESSWTCAANYPPTSAPLRSSRLRGSSGSHRGHGRGASHVHQANSLAMKIVFLKIHSTTASQLTHTTEERGIMKKEKMQMKDHKHLTGVANWTSNQPRRVASQTVACTQFVKVFWKLWGSIPLAAPGRGLAYGHAACRAGGLNVPQGLHEGGIHLVATIRDREVLERRGKTSVCQ